MPSPLSRLLTGVSMWVRSVAPALHRSAVWGGRIACALRLTSRFAAASLPLALDAAPLQRLEPVGARFTSSAATGAALDVVAGAKMVRGALVKVGNGTDSLFKHDELLSMDRMTLLKELAKDEGFRGELAGVSLSRCIVKVVASASVVPSPAEESAAVDLVADDVLGKHVQDGKKCFVRVHLPPKASAVTDGELLSVQLLCCGLPACWRTGLHNVWRLGKAAG